MSFNLPPGHGAPQRGVTPERRWLLASLKRPADCDAAKRIADAHTLHLVALGVDAVGQWIAFTLEDGKAAPTPYPTRADAERFHDPYRHGFVEIQPIDLRPMMALVLLDYMRGVQKMGGKMPLPKAPGRFDRTMLRNN